MRYLFFLSLLASVSLCGCSGCEIPCDPIRVPISQLRWSAAPLDNSGAAPLAAKNASVPREAFGIRLSCPADFNPADTVGASALCGVEFGADTPIVSIRIISVFDWDAAHPAGSDVTDLFQTILQSYTAPFNVPKNATPPSYTRYAPAFNATSLLNSPNELLAQADLLLTAPPPVPITAQFAVELMKSDSSTVWRNTPIVNLF